MTGSNEILEARVQSFAIEVTAGLGGENSDVFAYVSSPTPSWVKSVDDPAYQLHTGAALGIAKELARKTGKTLILKLTADYNSIPQSL